MRVWPITQSWLFSKSAQQTYFACACTIFGSLVFVFALITANSVFDASLVEASPVVRSIAETVALAAALAAGILLVGMLYHALQTDGLERNGFWILGLLLLGELGAVLYYVFYYRRSLKRAALP
jgi:hypothetical protein